MTTIPRTRIDMLTKSPEMEHCFAALCYPLLQGREVDGHWLQIAKANVPKNKEDDAIYEVDFSVLCDEETIGYLDIECKPQWREGAWPYPITNIAREPLSHWQANRFNGRMTNKLRRFQQKPDMSFWVGVRADWGACWVVDARTIFTDGREGLQGTRYSETALPVIQISNLCCVLCSSAEQFADYILRMFSERYHDLR